MRTTRIVSVTLAALVWAGTALAGGVDEGKKDLKEGRYAAAAEAFRGALKAAPGNRDAMLGLAAAVADGRLGDAYDEVQGLLLGALKAKEDDRAVRVALGNLYLARAADDDRFRADVQDQFGRLLRADATDEDAAVGLARMYYAGADYERGIAQLDAVLATKPTAALALYWRGVLRYDEAAQAFGKGGGMDDAVRKLFEEAQAAFEGSTKADPSRYDAWVKLGYTAQYLTRVDPTRKATAAAAYLKALDLDGENAAPMKGLSALYANDGKEYMDALTKLAADRPKTPIVQYYWGFALQGAGKVEEAEKAYRLYATTSKTPAMGWFQLGELLRDKKGDPEGARKAYVESLKAASMHAKSEAAVYWLLQPINEKARDAVDDAAKAKALLKEYDAVIALAPKNITAKNDAGFFLREAYGRTKDRALLDASISRYEAASALIGEWRPEYEQSVPYRDRHGFAQVLNDTGLMYQFYPEVRDLKKAEAYYRRAMEWTDHGYWDTYGNMMKILEGAGRFEDAYEFAQACADGIKQESGEPQETFRGTCRGDVERLAKKLGK